MMQEKYPTRQNNQNNPYVSSGASFASQYWGEVALMKAWYPVQKSEWAEVWIARSPDEMTKISKDLGSDLTARNPDNFLFDEF